MKSVRAATRFDRGETMASLIALVCDAHPDRGAEGPFITLVDGLWAFCALGYVEGEKHRWKPIDPSSVEMLRARRTHASEAPHSGAAGE